MKLVYIGLGSNVGDREANLRNARARLDAAGVRISRSSSIYETEPRDLVQQPWFLNQVVEAETELLPRRLLSALLRIEREMGRRRTVAKGPRLIDLDLLLYGSSVIDAGDLEVPHPRMTERRFVLEPLAELNPKLRIPSRAGETSVSLAELLAAVKDQQIKISRDGRPKA